ncbi:MAG: DUF6438 domain-containing protein [Nitrososphaera sp.]|uniref:DUF6438 domain-containing protein n=1 Tax=Nitrososphaera sp. TaxID=1971748 RepID=UPI003D6DEE34
MSSGVAAVTGGLAVGIAFVVMFSLFAIPSGFRGDVENVVITLERTPCFGFCPSYHVAVYGNGTVVYEGRDFVEVKGEQRSEIPQQDVKELIDEFYAADFFSLRDRYEAQITDLPSQTTSITIDGTTKTVYRYGFEPERLAMLEDRLDKVAGTEKWVK